MRERTRLELHDKRTCRGILTFTSAAQGENALKKFDEKIINNFNSSNLKVVLKDWVPSKEEGGKVFVPGLNRVNDENKIRAVFEAYG